MFNLQVFATSSCEIPEKVPIRVYKRKESKFSWHSGTCSTQKLIAKHVSLVIQKYSKTLVL